MTVYVVDDDESVRVAIMRLLKSARIAAQSFASAEEFLAADIDAKDSCVVADYWLSGMSGLDLKEEMGRRGDATPMILITGHDSEETRARSKNLGIAAYFRKPVDAQALLDAIAFTQEDKPLATN